MNKNPPCCHCRTRRSARSGLLCQLCFGNPDIRLAHPPRIPYGFGADPRHCPTAPTPTTALPGSPEKVRVLTERARRGQELFHTDDAVEPWNPRRDRARVFARIWHGGRGRLFER